MHATHVQSLAEYLVNNVDRTGRRYVTLGDLTFDVNVEATFTTPQKVTVTVRHGPLVFETVATR